MAAGFLRMISLPHSLKSLFLKGERHLTGIESSVLTARKWCLQKLINITDDHYKKKVVSYIKVCAKSV